MAETHQIITKVWIAPGCIVCDACENDCPEVFEVLEDTCIIRFMSGPPYEDVAFRIIDRDWDYSAKHDRGFKSTFEKGILTLHFSFKKVYYRK